MDNNDLHEQLVQAAEGFPVRGWPPDLHRRVQRRRRAVVGIAVAAGIAAAAAVTAPVVAVRGWPFTTVAVPVTVAAPTSHAAPLTTVTGSAAYVGTVWRLAEVTGQAGTTTIPATIGAQFQLRPDGSMDGSDGVNHFSGEYTVIGNGFEVRNPVSTLVGYADTDPQQVAAVVGMRALLFSQPPSGGCIGCLLSPTRDTVLGMDGSRLVIQADVYRLSFDQTRPTDSSRPPGPSDTHS